MPRTQVLEAVVRVRADTRQAQRGVQQMGRGWQAMANWTQRMRQGIMGANQMLAGQGAIMVAGGLAIRSAVRNFENYSRQQARLRSILATTNQDMRAHNYLMQSGDAASREYGFGMADSAEAMGTLFETGVEAHEAMRYFGTVTEFARAANVDMNTSARVLVDSMRQFNMQSEAGARQLAGAFTVAGRMSSTSIEELQQAFRYASVEMSGLGYGANETIAALAGMSAIGLRSTTAGTRLRGMLAALHTVTQTTRDRVDELGASSEDLNSILYDEEGRLRPLIDATERLSTFFASLPNQAARNEIAIRMFGRRALAAGVMLSRLHARGEDWIRVAGAINDEEEVGRLLHESAEAQMQSFAAQMDMARRSMQEFGIAFMEMLVGPMTDSRQGFGQYLTDLALAVRGADNNTQMTGLMRRQYEQLTPEMRQTGRELRETLSGLAELLRILAHIGAAIGRLAGQNPRLAATFILVGSAVRPLIPLLMQLNAQAIASGAGSSSLAGRLLNIGRAGGIARLGLQALIIDLAGRGSTALTTQIAGWMGLNSQLEIARQNMPESIRALSMLPIIGPWIEQLTIGVGLMREAWDMTRTAAEEQAAEEARRAQVATAAAERGPEERRRSAEREHLNNLRELASSYYREGIQGESALAASLRLRYGWAEDEAQSMARQLAQFQREGGGEYAYDEMSRAHHQLIRGVGLEPIAELFGYDPQRRRTEHLLRQIDVSRSEMERLERQRARTGAIEEGVIQTAEREESRVFGVAPREAIRRLAELPTSEYAPMFGPSAPTTVEFAPEVTVQPTQLEIDLNIGLEADGRELATIVGRHLQTVEERRGSASVRPGSRRRVAETGAR